MIKQNKPELLAPAGTPEALSAAIAAGADAVYFGTPEYNARMNARNFSGDELDRALSLCHAHGVMAYITLNTQVYDRELYGALKCAETLYRAGADALIVADIGLSRQIHRYFPDFPLLASTQMTGHRVRDADYLSGEGFTRMVAARELSRGDIAVLCDKSPVEIEMFIHGALCVSVSGQCLMSSLIGGRSGNRGECAQPCRLPYNGAYPLSPKDLCLAPHAGELLSLGASSWKIEGRMKSPDYVYRVVSVYRRLIDEKRDATRDETDELAAAFSRSGFTDGFYTGTVKTNPNAMLGVRTDSDKAKSAESVTSSVATQITPRKVDINRIMLKVSPGEPSLLCVTAGAKSVTVAGATPEQAISRPLTSEYAAQQISKLGATPYTVSDNTVFDIKIADGLTLSASSLNALRRDAVVALTQPARGAVRECEVPDETAFTSAIRGSGHNMPSSVIKPIKTAEFLSADAITAEAAGYFDRIYLSLHKYDGRANGVILPPVIYDGETEKIRRELAAAVSAGAEYAIINGAGQAVLAREAGLRFDAGYRHNVNNRASAIAALDTGADAIMLSPELTSAQIIDIAHTVPASVIVYGRIPLMTTERCILRAVSGGKCLCEEKCTGSSVLTDRTKAKFPIYAIPGCRSVIYNSVPVYMADRRDILNKTGAAAWHFIFTDEDSAAVDFIINSYKTGREPQKQFRRIK